MKAKTKAQVKRATRKAAKNARRRMARRNLKTQSVQLAVPSRLRFPGAQIRGSGNRIVLRHKEAITELYGTNGAEAKTSFLLNPGNARLHRWGSSVSRNYETYKYRRINIIWDPSVPSTTDGYIRHYYDFDATDAGASSSLDALSNYGAKSGNVWAKQQMSASQGNLNKLKARYIRESSSWEGDTTGAGNLDSGNRTSDAGMYHLYHQSDLPVTKLLGVLSIEYEVELETPQVTGSINPVAQMSTTEAALPHKIKDGTEKTNGVYSSISTELASYLITPLIKAVTLVDGASNQFTNAAVSERLLKIVRPGLYRLQQTIPVKFQAQNGTNAMAWIQGLMPYLKDVNVTSNTTTTITAADLTSPYGQCAVDAGDGRLTGGSVDHITGVFTKFFNILAPVTLSVRNIFRREAATGGATNFAEYNITGTAAPETIHTMLERVSDVTATTGLVYPLLFTAAAVGKPSQFGPDAI